MKTHIAIAVFGVLACLTTAVLGTGVVAETQAAEPSPYAPQKVVYHNNGRGQDSAAYFKSLLKNLRHHVDAVGADRIEIRVVDHGDGIGLLQIANSDPEIAKKIDVLRADGVRFLVCRNTLKGRNIDWHTLYGVREEDIVPSGMAELIRLQQQGFAYIHP